MIVNGVEIPDKRDIFCKRTNCKWNYKDNYYGTTLCACEVLTINNHGCMEFEENKETDEGYQE